MMNSFNTHVPETVVFALDLDPELGTEVSGATTRLDVIKHAITNFVLAKKRLSGQHKYALVALRQETAELLPFSTQSTEHFLSCLQQLQPPEDPYSSSSSSSDSSSKAPLDLGSLVTAVAPLQRQRQHQRQQQPCAVKALQIHGGVLSVPQSSSRSDSFNSHDSYTSNAIHSHGNDPDNRLMRVILIYGRSRLPAPVLDMSNDNSPQGLAVDCLYVHDKPQPGVNQPQEVYSALEDLVDQLSARAEHSGFVYETTGGRFGKLLSSMAMLLSHPLQRPPQSQTKTPLDLSAAPLMMLPSDAANAASGVPIITPKLQHQNLQGSAWAKPLSVHSDAAGSGSSYGAWGVGAAAAAAGADGGSTSSGSSKPVVQGSWGGSSSAADGSKAIKSHPTNLIDPWDEPTEGVDAAAAAVTATVAAPADLLFPPTVAVVSSSGVSSNSSSSSSEGVVTGVPATVVAGVPDRQPSYDFTDDGVALGYAVTDSRTPLPDLHASGSAATACNSRESLNRTTAASPPAAAGLGAPFSPWAQRSEGLNDFKGLEVDEDVDSEELEGLRAALMASAIEAQMQQLQRQQRRQ